MEDFKQEDAREAKKRLEANIEQYPKELSIVLRWCARLEYKLRVERERNKELEARILDIITI
jgi:hypothetical protein